MSLSARRFQLAWLLIALACFVPLNGCRGSETEPVADQGRNIALTVNDSGFGAIWLMDSDGGNRIRLTAAAQAQTDASGSTSPAWSPDRTLIAFASTGEIVAEDQREAEIYVMRADGSGKRRLTNDLVYDATPAWSPDGKSIAFSHMPGFGTEEGYGVIVAMNADGRGPTQLTRHPETSSRSFDSQPEWSPDGSLIAFTRATFPSDGQARVGIYTIRPNGEGERLLVEDAADPSWSPDGSNIVFTSIRDRNGKTCFHDCSPSGEIYLARADGDGLKRLTTSEADDHSPSWSPGGRRIAFVSDRSDRGDHQNEIYTVAADGTGLRRLTTNDVWDLEPAWR